MSDVARLEASLEEMLNNILTELLNLNEGPVDQVYDINVKVTTICKENNHLIEESPSLKALIKKISDEILLREDTLIAEQPDYTGDPNRDENWIDNVTGRRVQYLNEKLKSILKNLNSDDPSDQIYDIMDQVKLLEENNKNIITDQPNTQSLIKKIYDKITDYESELIAERLGYEDDYDTLNKKLDNYLTVLIKFDDGQGIDPIRQISKKVGILCEKHEHIIKCSQALELCIKKIHFHIATITNRIKGKTGNVQSTPQKIYLVDTELVNILSLLKDIDEPSDIVDDLKERVKTLCTLNKNVIDKSSELQLVVKEIEDKVEYLSTYNYYSLKQKLDNILTILTNFKDSDGHESIIQINEEVEMLCTKYGHLIKHSHELRLCLKRINSHVSIITNQLRYDNNNYDSKSLEERLNLILKVLVDSTLESDKIHEIDAEFKNLCILYEDTIKYSKNLKSCIKKINQNITRQFESNLIEKKLTSIVNILRDINEPSELIYELSDQVKTICVCKVNIIKEYPNLQKLIKEINYKITDLANYKESTYYPWTLHNSIILNYDSLTERFDEILLVLETFNGKFERLHEIKVGVEIICSKYEHIISCAQNLKCRVKQIYYNISLITKQIKDKFIEEKFTQILNTLRNIYKPTNLIYDLSDCTKQLYTENKNAINESYNHVMLWSLITEINDKITVLSLHSDTQKDDDMHWSKLK